MVHGIDVSKWNGVIDWDQVKKDGIDFAIVRAGYGRKISQKDPFFERNWAGAKAAGLHLGSYWYSYATTTAQAKEEAKVFLTAIQGKPFDYPLFFDQEYEPAILALTNGQRTAICNAFIQAVQSAGYTCGLYSSQDYYTTKLVAKNLVDCPLWIAKYSSTKPTFPCDIWQYTGSGKVAGCSGQVDRNYCYTNFAAPATETEQKEAESMTQEQFDAMLENYLARRGKEDPGSWAKEALSFCVEKGILRGDESGALHPKSFVTREELAAVAERLLKQPGVFS